MWKTGRSVSSTDYRLIVKTRVQSQACDICDVTMAVAPLFLEVFNSPVIIVSLILSFLFIKCTWHQEICKSESCGKVWSVNLKAKRPVVVLATDYLAERGRPSCCYCDWKKKITLVLNAVQIITLEAWRDFSSVSFICWRLWYYGVVNMETYLMFVMWTVQKYRLRRVHAFYAY